jgi:hypothetical protein
MADQVIHCSVTACKYNAEEQECAKHGISICNCGSQSHDQAHDKEETKCDSFVEA